MGFCGQSHQGKRCNQKRGKKLFLGKRPPMTPVDPLPKKGGKKEIKKPGWGRAQEVDMSKRNHFNTSASDVKVLIDNKLHMLGADGQVAQAIRGRLTSPNPAFLEAEKRGFWTGNMEREIKGYQVDGNTLTMPRGFICQALGILKYHGVAYELDDRRRTLALADFRFRGELRDFQTEAVESIFSRDFGTLSAPTVSGKTVMALYAVSQRRQPALIAVHSKELQSQWTDRIETFLGIPASEVGIIGGGKRKVGERITVALVQTLCKCAEDVAPRIGFLIVDECHRIPSRTFTEAVTAFDCRFMLGLSATPWRRDKLSRLIYWHLGDKVFEVDKEALVDAGHILQAEVSGGKLISSPTMTLLRNTAGCSLNLPKTRPGMP